MSSQPVIGVIGATGTVGRSVRDALLEAGASVVSLTRSAPAAMVATEGHRVFDWADEATWTDALAGVTRLFVLSPLSPELPALESRLGDHVAGRVEYVVKLSAYGVGLEPPIMLGRLHGAAEQAIGARVPMTALRPNGFMDNFAVFHADAIRAGCIEVAQGAGRTSFIDARDIGRVAASLLLEPRHAGEALTLTGPEALDNHAAAACIADALGRAVTYSPVAAQSMATALLGYGMPSWLVELLGELDALVESGGAAEVTDHVHQVTGAQPRSLADWARANRARFA